MLRLYIIMPMIGPQQKTRRGGEHPKEVRAYLSRLYGEERRAYACRARSPEEFGAWQRTARSKLVELLGLVHIAESSGQGGVSVELDPNAEQLEGYSRGTGRIQTEPDVWVEFWILKPDGPGPFPLAVTPHGHENGDEYAGVWDAVQTREKIARTDQDVAVQAAKRGFLAIAPATRGMGRNPSSYRIRDIADRVGRDCRCHGPTVRCPVQASAEPSGSGWRSREVAGMPNSGSPSVSGAASAITRLTQTSAYGRSSQAVNRQTL